MKCIHGHDFWPDMVLTLSNLCNCIFRLKKPRLVDQFEIFPVLIKQKSTFQLTDESRFLKHRYVVTGGYV